MSPCRADGNKFYVAEGEWFVDETETANGAMLNGDRRMPRMVAGARNATSMLFKIKIL